MDNPIFALVLFGCAILGSTISLAIFPAARSHLEKTRNSRLQSLDGLRGLLAVSVVIHHVAVTWGYLDHGIWEPPPSYFYEQLGKVAVALFFMASSFLFWSKILLAKTEINWILFFKARAFRLYPAYLFASLIIFGAIAYFTQFHLNIPKSMLARNIGSWLAFQNTPINGFAASGNLMAGAMWTLPYEWLLYVSLPVLALAKTRKLVPVVAPCLILVPIMWRFYDFEPRILATFLGGGAAAYLVRIDRVKVVGRSAIAGAIACLLLITVLFYPLGEYSLLWQVLVSVVFLVVCAGNSNGGFLTLRPVLWLGEATYSVYLFHGMVLFFVLEECLPFHDMVPYVTVACIAMLAIIPISSQVFLRVELPLMQLGKGKRIQSETNS